jgi:hypothetical protein
MLPQRSRRPTERFVESVTSPMYILLFFPMDNTYNIYGSNSHYLPSDSSALTAPIKSPIFVTCGGEKFEAIICARGTVTRIHLLFKEYINMLICYWHVRLTIKSRMCIYVTDYHFY